MKKVKVKKSKDGKKAHFRSIPYSPMPSGIGLFDVASLKRSPSGLESDLISRFTPWYPSGVPERVKQAVRFGMEAHEGQVRKYTREPYIYHPVEVGTILLQINPNASEDEVIACILHDTVEDCDVTVEDVRQAFGDSTAPIVEGLTDIYVPDGGKTNRKKRKELEAKRLGNETKSVQMCKAADLISNTSSITQHDPGFALRYLEEKQMILNEMTKLEPEVKDYLQDLITDSQATLRS